MENGIITHAYEDPFKDKSIKLITLENNNISEHEHRYYNHKYSQFYIVERNFDIPEHLRKFVKYNQLHNN